MSGDKRQLAIVSAERFLGNNIKEELLAWLRFSLPRWPSVWVPWAQA